MKKLLGLLLVIVIGVYGLGRFNLGESGTTRFLRKMESLVEAGRTAEVCAMFHDALRVEIADHAGAALQTFSGGKKEFCALTRAAAPALNIVPHSMTVEFTDVSARHELARPWSSEVTYSEHRTLTIPGTNKTFRTVSNDEITLVQTFSGVKLLKLRSEIHTAEAT